MTSDDSSSNPNCTINDSFITGDQSEQMFRTWLPRGWLPRKQDPDVFVDYVVEIVEKGEPTGRHFCAQVKGVKLASNVSMPRKFKASTKHVKYWLESCQHPLFLFLIDANKQSGYWMFVQKYVRERITKAALNAQKTVTLRFDCADNFAARESFVAQLPDAEKYVRDLHPSSVQAALQNARRLLEEKEPRLSYEITATEGNQVIRLSAKESFALTMSVENQNAPVSRSAFVDAIEQGAECKIPLQNIKFTGSRLFEELSGKPGEMVIDFGRELNGSMIFQVPTSQGAHNLQINGKYRYGARKARFNGGLDNAPLTVRCDCDFGKDRETVSTELKIGFNLKKWQGHAVLLLPYFEAIHRSLQLLSSEQGLQTEWMIEGNRIASGTLSTPISPVMRRALNILSWVDRCRLVASASDVNPCFPALESMTQEQIDTVDDLAALLSTGMRMTECPNFSARCTLTDCKEDTIGTEIFGSFRLEQPKAVFDFLGQEVSVGPVAIMFTNVKLIQQTSISDDQKIVLMQGNQSSMRIIKRLTPEQLLTQD